MFYDKVINFILIKVNYKLICCLVIFMALSALCVVLLYYTTNIDYNMILASAFQFNVGTANLVYISLIVDMFPPNVR